MLIIEKNVIRDCKCISVVWCSRLRAIHLEDPGSINWKGKTHFFVHSSYGSDMVV